MELDLYINDNTIIPACEIWFTASKSGGPGGQHVNKTNSRVTLYWNIFKTKVLLNSQKKLLLQRLSNRISSEGLLIVNVEDSRSQHQNKETAQKKLVEIIKNALIVQKKRIPTKISKSAVRRRLQDKKQRSAIIKMRRSPSKD